MNNVKIQIRRGVFETNSSSTHSLQITKGSIEDARADIIKNMFSNYTQKYESCIDGNTITIKGLYCESGGEEADIYTIISGWEAKLQYVASQLFYVYEDYDEESIDRLKEIFTKCVIDIVNKHGFNIDTVIYDVEYTNYYYDDINIPDDFPDDINYYFSNTDDIIKYVNLVMEDDFVITNSSEAYSSYEGKKIIIIE